MDASETSGGERPHERRAAGAVAAAGKYLTFRLGEELYGIEVLDVQEIIRMTEITRVPRTPPFVRGVINLRGKITPVIDMRRRFGMEGAEATERTCIIVVEPGDPREGRTMGLVVDEVSDVSDLEEGAIEPPPGFGEEGAPAFLLGVAKLEEKVVLLLHIDRVLTSGEAEVMAAFAARADEVVS